MPSAYFMTDVYLQFDRELNQRVFKPDESNLESRTSLASNEGVVSKKLIGSLRALWRSNKNGGHDERVRVLKSYLLPSPVREAATDADDEHEAPECDNDNDPEALADQASNDAGSNHDERSDVDGDALSGEEEESEADTAQDAVEGMVACADQDAAQSGNEEIPTSQDSSLVASTLRLGNEPGRESPESIDSESDSETSSCRRDSQVSSGWMGQAIMQGNHQDWLDREADEAMQRAAAREHGMMVDQIIRDLKHELDCELEPAYADWCYDSFHKYGDHVYEYLANAKNYEQWVLDKQTQDPGIYGI